MEEAAQRQAVAAAHRELASRAHKRCVTHARFSASYVDTTVQPKTITFPTDTKLLHTAIKELNLLSQKHSVQLLQSYLLITYLTSFFLFATPTPSFLSPPSILLFFLTLFLFFLYSSLYLLPTYLFFFPFLSLTFLSRSLHLLLSLSFLSPFLSLSHFSLILIYLFFPSSRSFFIFLHTFSPSPSISHPSPFIYTQSYPSNLSPYSTYISPLYTNSPFFISSISFFTSFNLLHLSSIYLIYTLTTPSLSLLSQTSFSPPSHPHLYLTLPPPLPHLFSIFFPSFPYLFLSLFFLSLLYLFLLPSKKLYFFVLQPAPLSFRRNRYTALHYPNAGHTTFTG